MAYAHLKVHRGDLGKRRLCRVRSGDAKFIVQNFHNHAFAENFMIRIDVQDLEASGAAAARAGQRGRLGDQYFRTISHVIDRARKR